jgi:two-component system KDP operon response regulator KdpE
VNTTDEHRRRWSGSLAAPREGVHGVTRVLVVEDEAPMRRALTINLRARHYDVNSAETGEEALLVAGQVVPDVVLLDLGLPGISGLEVIDGLRAWSSMPIVILSARFNESDKVAALDAGADDFVTKPFGIEEMLARLRAAIRRFRSPGGGTEIATADFVIHPADRTIKRPDGSEARLTAIEWRIVEALVRHPGRLVTLRNLVSEVWGPTANDGAALRVHLTHIRQKLEPSPSRPRYFITENGIGFRFVPV